jgi:hypothetical protein
MAPGIWKPSLKQVGFGGLEAKFASHTSSDIQKSERGTFTITFA